MGKLGTAVPALTSILGSLVFCCAQAGGRSAEEQKGATAELRADRSEAVASGRVFYASPDGRSSGDGSRERPLDLATALSASSPARPGDTVWLRGGLYRGTFTSELHGAEGSPIIVRQYPGEHAAIDGGSSNGATILLERGTHTWFWGFEIFSSDPDRTSTQNTSGPSDVPRGAGFSVYQQAGIGVGSRFINLIVHDTRGSGLTTEAIDAEVYGCILYYNGWDGPDRGHGHGLYVQNENGTKRIVDNILFGQFSHGFHAYGSDTAYLDNLYIAGNTLFNNGDLSSFGLARNLLLGGGRPARNPVLADNALYYRDGGPTTALNMGYSSGCSNATMTGNYVSNNSAFINCAPVTLTGNTFFGAVSGISKTTYPDNEFLAQRPGGTHVLVRPNAYEPGRGHVTVYNWDRAPEVDVDLSGILSPGSTYEIRNAQDYFGALVASGTYAGGPVRIPMTGLSTAVPVGRPAPEPTGPEFNAFVVVTTGAKRPTPRQAPETPASPRPVTRPTP